MGQTSISGDPLTLVPEANLSMCIYRLRQKTGQALELKGRGKPRLYVNDDCTAGLLVRSTGRKRWTFLRIGTLTEAEIAWIHRLG